MALYSNTLAQLIERVVRVGLGQEWYGGTATGGSTSTLIDTARYEKDDFFQSTVPPSKIHIISTLDGQAPLGETRQITDWTQTGTATVGNNFTASPESGDTYVFMSDPSWDEIKAAINTVIDSATAKKVLVEKVDEETEIQSSTYEYNVPTGFVYIYRITQADGSGDFPDPIPPDQYKILRGQSIPKIHFYRTSVERQDSGVYYGQLWGESDMSDGKKLRIEGLGRQDKLVNGQDICLIHPNYICYQAAAYINAARVDNPDMDARRARFEIAQGLALGFLSDATMNLPPDSKRVT